MYTFLTAVFESAGANTYNTAIDALPSRSAEIIAAELGIERVSQD
jgi:hypothetical protein